jgi:plastocyanin
MYLPEAEKKSQQSGSGMLYLPLGETAHRIATMILGGVVCLTLAQAEDVDGTVIVKRALTKRKVTAPAGQYDRGAAVQLGSTASQDTLAFERSHVVIYLEGQRPSPPVTAAIEQKGRQFVPDLVVIPAGSSVSFPNLDRIFHNVFSLSKPKTFDLGNYPKGQTRLVAFPKPGVVFVNCRLHPNMTATVVVSPNQWNAIADASGGFALHGVAPGSYTIVAWHKTAGFFREQIEVTPNRGASIQFVIPLPEEGTETSHEAMAHEAMTPR